MIACVKKVEITREVIDKYGINDFITNLEILIDHRIYLKKNREKILKDPFKIIENALKISKFEEKKIILYFLENNLKRFDINKKVETLYKKSIKKYLKDKEKALNYCTEAYKLNPYDPKIKEHLCNLLRELVRDNEIKNYIDQTQ